MSRILLIAALACLLSASALESQQRTERQHRVQFDHLRVEQGLSQGSISTILQDHQGFLWIGTDDGLNRFDGYQFVVYRPDPSETQSLASNGITALGEDGRGRIWIGTSGGGYQSYNPETRKFTSHPIESSDGISLAGCVITALRPDRRGRIWIGTDVAGLHMFDPASGRLIAQRFPGMTPQPPVNDIAETRAGKLLMATGDAGLWLFDPENGDAKKIPVGSEDSRSGAGNKGAVKTGVQRVLVQSDRYLWVAASDGRIHRHDVRTGAWKRFTLAAPSQEPYSGVVAGMSMDSDERLWIVTPGFGLFILDTHNGSVAHITENRLLADGLPTNSLRCAYHDRLGNIWIGMNGSGLLLHSAASKEFNLISPGLFDPSQLPVYSYRAMWQGNDSVLWLGGYGGLARYDRRTKSLVPLPPAASTLSKMSVYALHPDPADRLRFMIVGTEGSGLFRLDVRSGRVEKVWPKGNSPVVGDPGRVYEIYETRDHTLWIGTSQGLLVWDRNSPASRPLPVAPRVITPRQGGIYAVREDRNGQLWIGTGRSGLAHYQPLTGQVTYYTQEPGNATSISSNTIKCIFEDSSGRLWIGTAGGLNLADRRSGKFRRYTTEHGLPNNVVYGILEDASGYLWLSTNHGLARFRPDTGVVGTYDVHDGLQGNEFNTAAYFSTPAGELFFGGVQGVTHFFPEHITRNRTVPPLVVTSVRAGNRDVPLRSSATGNDTIMLDDTVESISITFAALSYYRPEKNRYRYRIAGRGEEYIDLGTDRLLSFAGLSPGVYDLHIQGSNNDGVWNLQGLRLTLIVEPPFWATWWFRLIAGALVALTVFGGLRWRIARSRQQELYLAREVEHRTSELQHANAMLLLEIDERKKAEADAYRANATKSEFLAHISHEIRTPMNAILGFTELLQDKIREAELREFLGSIAISGRNLLTLINDMLDLSKIEAGRLELVYQPGSIRGIVDEIRQLFAFQVHEKKLSFDVRIAEEVPTLMNIDETRVRQILLNLVGNAMKFTERGGITIDVSCSARKDERCNVTIAVRDTGVGIAPSQQDRVFEPFRQGGGQSRNADYGGTGLGLAITQRLVRMMDGEIKLQSRLGVGSTFSVTLPAVLVAAEDYEIQIQDSDIETKPEPVADVREERESPQRTPAPVPELLRALHLQLEQSDLPRWERLKRTYIIHEIESFAIEIGASARRAAYSPLADWSDRLLREVRSFDMGHLPVTLNEFPELIASLKDQGNRPGHTIEGNDE